MVIGTLNQKMLAHGNWDTESENVTMVIGTLNSERKCWAMVIGTLNQECWPHGNWGHCNWDTESEKPWSESENVCHGDWDTQKM